MSTPRPEDKLVVVRWATDEFGGGVIASKLESGGIEARVVTDDPMGTTAFFRSKSSRRVAVMVREQDVSRADTLLQEASEGHHDLDWEGIDVGEPEDDLSRHIASGKGAQSRGWWWGGWPAALILLAAGVIALAFNAMTAMILWLAALIAAVGSGMSWMAFRMRARGNEPGNNDETQGLSR